MKHIAVVCGLILAMAGIGPVKAQDTPPRVPLSPPDLLRAIVNEASGELALQNEIVLTGVNRNRKPEEYQKGYFETAFILDKLREYGIDESYIVDLPVDGKTTWDAESAELWIVEPELRKIADLKEVPACLCSGSSTTDTTADRGLGQAGRQRQRLRLDGLVPVRTAKMGGMMSMWTLREELQKLKYQPPVAIMMAEMELRNFIDGKRSIFDLRDSASAEFEPLDLLDVEKWVGVQEKLGLVTIKKK